MNGPERILYVRTDRMGDVLMNLPALAAIRQNFPKTWLTLAVDRSVAPLFKEQPELDEVMELDMAALRRSLAERWRLAMKLRRIGYDIIVVSNPDKFFHWLSFAAGIPVRAGWRRKWPIFLNRTLPDEKTGRHEIDSNLELVRLVTRRPWTGTPRLAASARSKEEAAKTLSSLPGAIVALHTGTSDPAKRWPEERFADLAQKLEACGASLVLVGGAEEAERAAGIVSKLKRPCLDLTGKTTLAQLAGLFSSGRIKALVSTDSGPVHVAWMCGTPVVSFYAKGTPGSDPDRWGPRDGKSRTIYKPIGEISVAEALAVVGEVL